MKLQPKKAFGEREIVIPRLCKDEEGCSRWCKPKECTDFDLTIREGTYIVEGFASSDAVLRRRLG